MPHNLAKKKIRKLHIFIVSEVRCSKIKFNRAVFLLEALGESLFPSLVQLLEIAGTLVRAPPCIFNLAVWHLHSLSDLPFCCHISSSDLTLLPP